MCPANLTNECLPLNGTRFMGGDAGFKGIGWQGRRPVECGLGNRSVIIPNYGTGFCKSWLLLPWLVFSGTFLPAMGLLWLILLPVTLTRVMRGTYGQKVSQDKWSSSEILPEHVSGMQAAEAKHLPKKRLLRRLLLAFMSRTGAIYCRLHTVQQYLPSTTLVLACPYIHVLTHTAHALPHSIIHPDSFSLTHIHTCLPTLTQTIKTTGSWCFMKQKALALQKLLLKLRDNQYCVYWFYFWNNKLA